MLSEHYIKDNEGNWIIVSEKLYNAAVNSTVDRREGFTLNEAEVLSIKRLKHKGVSLNDIADRIGITIDQLKSTYAIRR